MDIQDSDFSLTACYTAGELDSLILSRPHGIIHLVFLQEFLAGNLKAFRQDGRVDIQFANLFGKVLEETGRLVVTRETKVSEVYDQLEVIDADISRIIEVIDLGLDQDLLVVAAGLRDLMVILSKRSAEYVDGFRRFLVA